MRVWGLNWRRCLGGEARVFKEFRGWGLGVGGWGLGFGVWGWGLREPRGYTRDPFSIGHRTLAETLQVQAGLFARGKGIPLAEGLERSKRLQSQTECHFFNI